MESKTIWASKTFWANIIGGVALLSTAAGLDLGLTADKQAELIAGIMVIANIVLRYVTKAPIGK